MRLAVLLGLATACARPHYLGAELPRACHGRDVDACLGWMVERDLVAAELGIYDHPRLRTYVQGVANRLARGSTLAAPPRVWIGDRDGTFATVGGRIVVARPTLERLGSEAELAGVIAHEMAHLEGGHTVASLFGPKQDAAWNAMRRDAEAIADERAIVLLERAGYAPTALGRALAAVLVIEDDEHPPKAERIARVDALARGRGGFEGRAELLHALEGMVVGRDTRLGARIGDAWVVATLGVALPLDEDDVIRAADELLVLRREHATLTAYAIGAPWARELTASLEDRQVAASALGQLTLGTIPRLADLDDSPLGKLQRALRGTLPQPAGGTQVAIVERGRVALVVELGGHHVPDLGARAATAEELDAAEPPRLELVRAPRTGTIGALGVCPRRLVDAPDRRVAEGELITCADRPLDGSSEHVIDLSPVELAGLR